MEASLIVDRSCACQGPRSVSERYNSVFPARKKLATAEFGGTVGMDQMLKHGNNDSKDE